MYLLEANAFGEANRLYYAFDIAPGFWNWLVDSSQFQPGRFDRRRQGGDHCWHRRSRHLGGCSSLRFLGFRHRRRGRRDG